MSTQQMRKMVSDCYDSETWKNKIKKMSDTQVVALYYSFLKRDKFAQKEKRDNSVHQMTVEDYIMLKEK